MAAIPSSSYLPSGSALLSFWAFQRNPAFPDREPCNFYQDTFVSFLLTSCYPFLPLPSKATYCDSDNPKSTTQVHRIQSTRAQSLTSEVHLACTLARKRRPDKRGKKKEIGSRGSSWQPQAARREAGNATGGYEEERESERIRDVRRRQAE
ncbi:hypothetical protein A0H81_03809 [Grifola frondosa]|uniref:Uncharacterized protein n=1 Tax=Grifola frondosa TaxID=5627 RepID=A0A1C7MKQ2_GRIFR|nr:hypothetical protein A0H81_03809 [Grifola frondosa]